MSDITPAPAPANIPAPASPSFGADLPPWPQIDFSEFGETEVKPLSRVQKLVGSFLSRNWVSIPHVTHQDDADVGALEEYRKRHNAQEGAAKLTSLVFMIKAVVKALQAYPQFNASLDGSGKNLVFKKYFNIGVAVDTKFGLLVAVLRNCDSRSVTDLATDLAALSQKARTKGLSLPEMSGGCFTISSLGGIGGTSFTPIINAPEVAILGLCKTQQKPSPGPAGEVLWRQMLPLSLSYDHRVINGADAARFTQHIAGLLEDPAALSE
jgi:pyruvate dehydrogenase E2 component (dihydrolipoamide acetyltransferase)